MKICIKSKIATTINFNKISVIVKKRVIKPHFEDIKNNAT